MYIPKKQSKEDVIEEANNTNTTNKVSRRKIFKLFFKSLECIKINIFLKFPLIIVTLIMNVPPIMAVPLANVL